MPTARWPPMVLAATLVLVTAAASAAAEPRPLTLEDDDALTVLEQTGAPETFLYEDDGDGSFDGNETVYLSNDTALDATDVVLREARQVGGNASANGTGGNDSADNGTGEGTVVELAAAFCFIDRDGDGVFSLGDTMVLDPHGEGQGVLGPRDVHIVGEPGEEGEELTLYENATGYVDMDLDIAYTVGDVAVLDIHGDRVIGPQDIRLVGPDAPRTFGPEDPWTAPVLHEAAPDHLVAIDLDDDGKLDSADPVYLQNGTNKLSPGAIALTPATGLAPGEVVRAGDEHLNTSVGALRASIATHDANGDGRHTPGEVVYIDLSNSANGTISTRDVVLSGPDLGLLVGPNSSLQGEPLVKAAIQLTSIDRNGNARYDPGDVVVLDVDRNGVLTPGDLYVSGQRAGDLARWGGDDVVTQLDHVEEPRFTLLDEDGNGQPSDGDTLQLHLGVGTQGPVLALGPGPWSWAELDNETSIRLRGQLGAFQDGDLGIVVLDLAGNGSANLTAGDVLLTGPDAGTVVGEDASGNLTTVHGLIAWTDADASNEPGPGDGLYIDGRHAGIATPGDMRIIEPQPSGNITWQDSGGTEEPIDVTRPSDQSQGGDAGDDDGDGDGTDGDGGEAAVTNESGNGTPAPGLAATLLALVVALAGRRAGRS